MTLWQLDPARNGAFGQGMAGTGVLGYPNRYNSNNIFHRE